MAVNIETTSNKAFIGGNTPDDGKVLGYDASDKIAFYGAAPATQPATITTVDTTTVTTVDTTTVTTVQTAAITTAAATTNTTWQGVADADLRLHALAINRLIVDSQLQGETINKIVADSRAQSVAVNTLITRLQTLGLIASA